MGATAKIQYCTTDATALRRDQRCQVQPPADAGIGAKTAIVTKEPPMTSSPPAPWRRILPAALCTATLGDAAKKCPPTDRPVLLPTQRPTRGRHIYQETTMTRTPRSSTTAPSDIGTAARWRRILPTALCAAAVGAALTVPAIANAEPREWDIGGYDDCVKQSAWRGDTSRNIIQYCCEINGGLWDDSKPALDACHAPPAEPAQVRPGLLPPGGVPTLTAVPATPTPTPGVVISTPAPIIGG